MNNVTRTHDERSKGKEEQELILYFLDDDEDERVHVEEAKEVDLSKVTRHLNSGGSVFITHRRRPRSNTDPQKRFPGSMEGSNLFT
ncbi:MAG: hypothetical protein OEY31_03345 [Candidatus Bathyarchaeota archaeon]|nr:hypothetical protein [Candidatus Bathyarchaeota archaeon]